MMEISIKQSPLSRLIKPFIFLLFTYNTIELVAQTFFEPDVSYIKKMNIKTNTMFDCGLLSGNNCYIVAKNYHDTMGRLLHSDEYINDKVYLTTEYTYNSLGKPDTVYQKLAGQKRKIIVIHKYDANGNEIEAVFLNDKITIKIEFKYNPYNLLISELLFHDKKRYTEKHFFMMQIGIL